MGRPRGSKNKVHTDNGEDAPQRNTVSGEELRGYIERIEALNKEQKEISSDRQAVFKELSKAGYDRDTVRALVSRRKLTREQREAADALMDEYTSALGEFVHTELGKAGLERMRAEEERAE